MKLLSSYKIAPSVKGLCIAAILMVLASRTLAVEFIPEEISLRGMWKFRIGDRTEWASPTYNDRDWDDIRVPARWEDAGYQGYDGFAWYRTTIKIPAELKNQTLVLQLGYIDDADEVYINGKKIGQSGSFPPHYESAYNALRKYQVPNEVINFGTENTIAVRVYDSQLSGGIVSGDIKLFTSGEIAPFDINLSGEWQFNKGRQYTAGATTSIMVPGQWENQGFYNYDGYAVYSRIVRLPKSLAGKRLVLVAGRIDDTDQVAINGQVIGQTGNFNSRNGRTMYAEFRNYFIAPDVLKTDQDNLIEIRVLDTGGEGGILEGPVGIISQDQFRKYWKNKRRF